jgi:hypothetical protein
MLTIQEQSLDWALAHVQKQGDTDVLPPLFEYHAIAHDWIAVRTFLSSQDVLAWKVRPHRVLLAPKALYGFRAVTQLDPFDFLVFTAIVKEIASDLESGRIPVSEERVFSYRYRHAADGTMFDPSVGYINFLLRADKRTQRDCEYVAVTDIADFYARIYHHRLEGALEAATTKRNHTKAIHHLLSGWNGTETFGIPVGSAPARLLAETCIADVDAALLARDTDFIRYNDDYRIFARSHEDAYRSLSLLADTLYRNHGLTLQQRKTDILSVAEFRKRYLSLPARVELESLKSKFTELIESAGLDNPYEPIDYDDLDDDQKELVDGLNLLGLLEEQLRGEGEIDIPTVRFVLRRLGQLGNIEAAEIALDCLDRLHPVLPAFVEYLLELDLDKAAKQHLGKRVISLMTDSLVSDLEYHRVWSLEPFARSADWDNEGAFLGLLGRASDPGTRRQLILALGRSAQRHWFQSQWRTPFDEQDWPRRAVIAAASCLPTDARKHWYKSIESRLDPLELAVMKWARSAPFA